MSRKRVFIVDGYGQIYRSYFAFITNPLKDKNGNNVSAVFGFFNIIMMLIRQYNPDYLIVAMDSKGKTFRHQMYDQYKANRDKTPEDLHAQIPVIEHILDEMHIPHYAQVGMEADDIVATICKSALACDMDSVMVTGDKDLLQLVRDGVSALRPPRKGEHEYKLCGCEEVKELFGVKPEQIVDYLTILGDSSDNVPGITGIGEKGAVKLLTEYGSLEAAYKHLELMSKSLQAKLEAAKDHLQLSHDLIVLKDDLFSMKAEAFAEYTTSGIDWARGVELFNEIGAEKLAISASRFIDGKGAKGVGAAKGAKAEVAAKGIAKASLAAGAGAVKGGAKASLAAKASLVAKASLAAGAVGKTNLFVQADEPSLFGPLFETSEASVEGTALEKAPEMRPYKAITTAKELEEALSCIEDGAVVAFDLETTSRDDMKAVPVGFSFATRAIEATGAAEVTGAIDATGAVEVAGAIDATGAVEVAGAKAIEACYVPLVAGGKRYISAEEAKASLAKHLVRFKIVGQNIKYDLKVLKRWGVQGLKVYADTMIMAWMVDSGASRYNLDDLAKKYLDYDTVKFEDVVPEGKLFSDINLTDAVRYGAEDSDITLRLYETLLPLLQKGGLEDAFFNIEMPLVDLLCNMELEGVLLDPSQLDAFKTDLEKEISEVQNSIFTLCGREFNLNSPRQLQEILFVDRNLPTGKKTHSGFSTDSDVLEELSSSTDDPVPPLILRYRMLNKLLSTYVVTLPTLINPETGRIHTSFFQTGTATGRLSSKNPNLQNIPIRTEEGRRIRAAFVPKAGCVLMSADYSQIELVVLAHISGDENLKAAFIAGEDVHKDTAAKIFKVFPDLVTAQQRRAAKTINFGIMYGMSAFRLSKDLKISRSDAKKFIDVYFEEYSGVRDFIERVKVQAREDGFVKTAMGHVRFIPEMKSSNKAVLAGAERIAVNTIIQGTAAEIMKLAMISTSKAIKEKGLASKILLQVHDEMIFEVPKQEVEQMTALVLSCMENAYKLSIPLKVGLETGSSWGEMH